MRREVRNSRGEIAKQRQDGRSNDNLTRNLGIALESLRKHPEHVHDAESAMKVKGIGGRIAKLIENELFLLYPPEETIEDEESIKAFEEQTESASQRLRKRRCSAERSHHPSKASQETFDALDHGSMEAKMDDRDIPASSYDNTAERHQPSLNVSLPDQAQHSNVQRTDKTGKEYVPKIGSANFAFLVSLLTALKGPEKLEYLTKHDLIARAEASGLSDKPIQGEGASWLLS